MGGRGRSLITVALLLAAGVLAARLLGEGTPGDAAPAWAVPAVEPAEPAPADLPPPPRFDPPDPDNFSEFADRPPFSPSRRPPSEAPAIVAMPVDPAPPAQPDFVLVGVNIGPGERAALIRPPDGTRPQWVREQDTVRGWRVVTVDNDRLVVEGGGNRVELSLRPQATVPP